MESHWIPQDDLLLRKSIENGASLESLAKGAVKFSRNFTLVELTERWHSLLYDPNVISLSSSAAFEDQYSSLLLPQTHTHQTTRVRTHYYTARKRMRLEEFLNAEDDIIDHNAPVAIDDFASNNAFGDIAFNAGSEFLDLGFDEADIDNFHNAFSGIMQDDHGFVQANDEQMVNQLLNINDGQIQDFNVTDTTTTDHGFQDPLFQQLITSSFNETSTSSQIHPDSSSYHDLPIEPVAHCRIRMSVSELDPHPEIKNGVIICTLNQESAEIPDNDDFNPQLFKPKPRTPIITSSSRKHHMKPPLPPTRVSVSQARGNNDNVQIYGLRDCAATTKASCSSPFKDSTSSFGATTSTSLQHFPENEVYDQTSSAEMDVTASMSETYENNNEIESEEDLPSYSDVEAMILDMDLEPVGPDQYEMEAIRYQNEEMARRIMRLEQSSKSYMNRNIASHGAFALLYGSSRHYINKPEVLLGRATGEYPVDIDLGRLGSKTKISRRQALIKLKQDASFEIKNLGKFSIWMNDIEIEQGGVVSLRNNCLIQIRRMSFIFEVNEKAVKRYLAGIQK